MRQQPDRLELLACTHGCFHAKNLRIVVQQPVGGQFFLLAADIQGQRAKLTPCYLAPIIQDDAHSLVSAALSILSKPQHLAKNTSTTVYECTVSWSHGGTTTEWNVKTSEIEAEAAAELLQSPTLPQDKKALISATYKDHYNWAHLLFRLADSTVSKYVAQHSVRGDAPASPARATT